MRIEYRDVGVLNHLLVDNSFGRPHYELAMKPPFTMHHMEQSVRVLTCSGTQQKIRNRKVSMPKAKLYLSCTY